jgi:hypothetical protein
MLLNKINIVSSITRSDLGHHKEMNRRGIAILIA